MILNGTIAILIKYGYWKSQIVISNSSVYQKQLNREVVENLDHLPRKFINSYTSVNCYIFIAFSNPNYVP